MVRNHIESIVKCSINAVEKLFNKRSRLNNIAVAVGVIIKYF